MHAIFDGDVLALIGAIAAAGVVAGFLSGLLGIGGGGILVPVLYEAFGAAGVPEDVRMHMTLGTTLAVIAPTVLTSLRAHHARGAVDVELIRRVGPWVFLGVAAGVLLANAASSAALRWVWVVFGSLLALKMAFGRDDWRIADELPAPPRLEAMTLVVGVLSVLMGIGGATFMVPLLTLHGRSLLQAIGTATGIGLIIAIPGLIGYAISGYGVAGAPPFSIGYVNLGALLIAPLSVMSAPYGVRAAHRISKRALELAFALFLGTVVLRFLSSLI